MVVLDREKFAGECTFKTSRSGGKGGQNVNKVETKVELLFDIKASALFPEEQKRILIQKLSARIINDSILQLTASRERSQLKNKEHAIGKAIELIQKALKPRKPRKETKPTLQSIEKRLSNKQLKSAKKLLRKRIFKD